MYSELVLCRVMDERVWLLNRQGKAAIVASAQGHEATQIGSVHALRIGHDHFYIYYRDLAVLLALGMTPVEIMLGFAAKAEEPLSGARQFPTHGALPKYNLVNISNVVGTQLPQAVGTALSSKMRGDDSITIVYFGDGAASVGDCHESMNFAAIHKLPVIFLCENNKYAISVPLKKQMAIDNIASRAEAYGMPGVVIDGTDISAVYEATLAAAKHARSGEGPTLIEAIVDRYLPHTSDDDDTKYRTKDELDLAKQHDPIKILRKTLIKSGHLTDIVDQKIRQEAMILINEATEYVENIPYPNIDDFHQHVYAGDVR